MHFKASVEYGMRAVLYLAEKGSICSSREVADEMSIPRDYLIQLAQLLRNAGIGTVNNLAQIPAGDRQPSA